MAYARVAGEFAAWCSHTGSPRSVARACTRKAQLGLRKGGQCATVMAWANGEHAVNVGILNVPVMVKEVTLGGDIRSGSRL